MHKIYVECRSVIIDCLLVIRQKECYGEHPVFEHEIQKEGIIESLPSKLKEVYNQYLNVLEDGQPDIVQDN